MDCNETIRMVSDLQASTAADLVTSDAVLCHQDGLETKICSMSAKMHNMSTMMLQLSQQMQNLPQFPPTPGDNLCVIEPYSVMNKLDKVTHTLNLCKHPIFSRTVTSTDIISVFIFSFSLRRCLSISSNVAYFLVIDLSLTLRTVIFLL